MSASDLSFKELPTTEVARSLVRSLTRGTAIPEGVRFIHVGHANWLAAQVELLDELAVDSSSDTKFVRGSYGAGKSHFLSVVQDVARKRHWITSHVECKVDGVQIDRFETLYPKIALKMRSIDWNLSEEIDPAHRLLDKWVAQVFQTLGFRGSARPYDAEVKIFDQLVSRIGRSNLPTETIRALTAYTRASWVNDAESTARLPAGCAARTNQFGFRTTISNVRSSILYDASLRIPSSIQLAREPPERHSAACFGLFDQWATRDCSSASTKSRNCRSSELRSGGIKRCRPCVISLTAQAESWGSNISVCISQRRRTCLKVPTISPVTTRFQLVSSR